MSYQLPVTSYKLPITSYQLSVTSYQLPVTSYKLQVLVTGSYSYKLPVTRNGVLGSESISTSYNYLLTLGTRGFFSLTSGEIARRPSRVGRRPTQRAACREKKPLGPTALIYCSRWTLIFFYPITFKPITAYVSCCDHMQWHVKIWQIWVDYTLVLGVSNGSL